jgi:hypothetical protein
LCTRCRSRWLRNPEPQAQLYRKGGKNHANDAETIGEAVQRPSIIRRATHLTLAITGTLTGLGVAAALADRSVWRRRVSASFNPVISNLSDQGGIQFRRTIVTVENSWGYCDAWLT